MSFPPETFANLLLLYCKFEYFDLAADVMAENASFTYKYLSSYLYDYLDAVITMQTNPEDAYKKLDEMANKYTDSMRKMNKSINELVKVQGNANASRSPLQVNRHNWRSFRPNTRRRLSCIYLFSCHRPKYTGI